MLAESRFVQDVDVVALIVHALNRHHCICAVGHRPSRRNSRRCAGRERAGWRTASRDAVGDREPARRLGRANRESVHGRARKGRQIDGSACRLTQNASERLVDRHTFDRKKP
jgi:hypothetical protein